MGNILYDAIFAELYADEGALFLLPDGAEISRAAFHDMLTRAANAMRRLGVRPGDRVAVQIAKTPEALAIYAGAVAVGAVFLPLNTAYSAGEIGYFLNDARPALFLCDPTEEAALAPLAEAAGARILTLDANGRGSFAAITATEATGFSPEPRGGRDLAAILYTSGTTGRSKGAMLSHDNLLSNALVLTDLWRFTDEDVLLHALPVFHTHGLFVATNVALAARARMIFLAGFDMEQVLASLPQATALMGVPTFYTRLLGDPRFTGALVAHMRLFISGSAPLLEETHRAFEARTGQRILERYGMTETNMSTSNPFEGERRAGTVGLPLPGVEVRIMAEGGAEGAAEGGEVAEGQVGVIEVRGPNVFQGYWQMPEKTREELREDGWFITGDLGTMDVDGYIRIVGRAKDLVITGGFNVYPKEVELILDQAEGVLESAVIGVPHPDFGEAVFAVLARKPGAEPDPAAILAGLSGQLARFKQPKAAVVVDALPRNTMGKVQKNLLRESYCDWFRA